MAATSFGCWTTGPADFRSAFHVCPLPMLLYDRTSLRLHAANEAMAELIGYEAEELAGRDLTELVDPEGLDRLKQGTAGARAPRAGELTLASKDGRRVRLDVEVRPLLGATGHGATILVTAIDPTARPRAGRPLPLRGIDVPLGALVIPVCIVSLPTGEIAHINETLAALTGYGPSELIGRRATEVGLVSEADIHRAVAAEPGKISTMWEKSTGLRRRDGRVLSVLVSARQAAILGRPSLVVAFTDLSEQAATEARLAATLRTELALRSELEAAGRRRSFLLESARLLSEQLDYEQQLRQVAQIAVPRMADWCAVDIIDETGRLKRLAVVHSDPAKVALVFEIERRYPPAPDPNRGVYKVIATGEAEYYEEITPGLLEASARDVQHLRLTRELGLRSAIIAPLIARGRTIGALTLVMAESGRRYSPDDLEHAVDLARRAATYIENSRLYTDMEAAVSARTAELQAANRELESFSYTVSHDLRAPLRHLSGFAQLLDKHYREFLDEKGAHYLDNLADAAKRMGLLIDDLLAFSRIGRTELRLGQVDLENMVEHIVAETSADHPERNLLWHLSTLPPVAGDAALLEQAFRNLIDNAVKFSSGRNPAEIWIDAREEEGEVIFCVRDNGAGFDGAYADRLFEVFQRLHNRRDFEGTGIGLANVRRVVERHGGRTWAEGEVDKGAQIFFSLPKKRL